MGIALHQVLVAASPTDAITNSALMIRESLRNVADSDVFAWYLDDRLDGEIVPLQFFDEWCDDRDQAPLIIFHASIGEPEVMAFLAERRDPVVLVYHNISPADLSLPYDPKFAGVLEEGRRELKNLKSRVVMALADSTFNLEELQAVGFDNPRLAPLVVDVSRFATIVPDEVMLEELSRTKRPTILYVGQLLPHKRPDLLIQTHHVLSTYLEPDARLIVVGASRIPVYQRLLERFFEDLGLSGLFFGALTENQLAACYQASDVYLTMSEHEGFCVPVLEAMQFGVPVVARDFGAISETLGGAGIVLSATDPVSVGAEAVGALLVEDELRRDLIQRGERRLQHFDPRRTTAIFMDHLLEIV